MANLKDIVTKPTTRWPKPSLAILHYTEVVLEVPDAVVAENDVEAVVAKIGLLCRRMDECQVVDPRGVVKLFLSLCHRCEAVGKKNCFRVQQAQGWV